MNEAIWNDVNEWYELTSTSEKKNSINYWFMIIICTFARPNKNGARLQYDRNAIQANNPLKPCKQRKIMNYELIIMN